MLKRDIIIFVQRTPGMKEGRILFFLTYVNQTGFEKDNT